VSGVRCFAAIPLTPEFIEPLLEACRYTREHDHRWAGEKWVARENLHLTLAFFGSIDELSVPLLADALGDVCEMSAAFSLPFSGLRAAPQRRKATMLWATFLDPERDCSRLAHDVSAAAVAFGVEPPTRPFKPHATLVRTRRPHPLDAEVLDEAIHMLDDAPEAMSVERVSFVSSTLTPTGPVYLDLSSWALGGVR
jgi:2'-5' RNA ligase